MPTSAAQARPRRIRPHLLRRKPGSHRCTPIRSRSRAALTSPATPTTRTIPPPPSRSPTTTRSTAGATAPTWQARRADTASRQTARRIADLGTPPLPSTPWASALASHRRQPSTASRSSAARVRRISWSRASTGRWIPMETATSPTTSTSSTCRSAPTMDPRRIRTRSRAATLWRPASPSSRRRATPVTPTRSADHPAMPPRHCPSQLAKTTGRSPMDSLRRSREPRRPTPLHSPTPTTGPHRRPAAPSSRSATGRRRSVVATTLTAATRSALQMRRR